jgi:hypothetical protein
MNTKDLITKINDNSLSTRERGDALEEYIMTRAEEIGFDLKKTKGSGSVHGDGDIKNNELCIDGKVHGKCTAISVKATEIDKIRKQAAINDLVGIIATPIVKDDNVNVYLTIKFEDFIELLTKEK